MSTDLNVLAGCRDHTCNVPCTRLAPAQYWRFRLR